MNIVLTILQTLLALHTAVGAFWKLSNSERSMPSLGAIPHGVWLAMGALDLVAAIALTVGVFDRRRSVLGAIAAGFVAAEMIVFVGVHFASGTTNAGPAIYWLVVAAVSAFIAYGRLVRKPLRRSELAR